MKKVGIVLLIIILLLPPFVCIFVLNWGQIEKQYTREELENGLQKVELIYIIDDKHAWIYDVIYNFTKEEEQELIKEITKIEFISYSPHYSAGEYAIKFCYEEFSLIIAPSNIIKLDNNNTRLKNSESMSMGGNKRLIKLIDKYLYGNEM